MPYPDPTAPDYCPASRKPLIGCDPDVKWHTCPSCGRHIATMGNTGQLYPHVSRRVPRFDRVKDNLIAAGLNRAGLL